MDVSESPRDLERGPDNERHVFPALPALPALAAPAQNVAENFGSVGVRGTSARTNNQSGNGAPNNSPEDSSEETKDFDDSANPLWSLYEQEAKYRDEVQIQTLKDDMDGVLIFAGLFSAVLTSFVVPKIQDLEVNPANQAVYYQSQTVQILAQISQQIALIGTTGTQIPLNITQPLPYPTFQPSNSDRRVNVCWLMSLVFSLCAALVATVVQQWVRSYMGVFQRSSNPLKTARVRQFLFEGVDLLPVVAEAVPGLIHVSLFLFFVGFSDAILNINRTIGLTTVVPIGICGLLYVFSVITPLINPKSSYRNPFSGLIWYIIRKLRPLGNRLRGTMFERLDLPLPKMGEHQERLAMEQTDDREDRDVRAVQYLIENINGSNEMDNFVVAIPGSFNKEWGRNVWEAVSIQEGPTVDHLCGCVRYLFESYNNEGDTMNKETRRRRMHGCTEAAASLVCCARVQLGKFGEVGEVGDVLSELGHTEKVNELSTIRSNPSFTVRWTCLSLVAIRQMVMGGSNRIRQLSAFAVSGIARFQLGYGAPDVAAFNGAQRIDDYLRTAWEHVEDLHRAFKFGGLSKTREEIRNILGDLESPISKLERIEIEADGIEDVDWRISLLQEAMDDVTHKLARRLPGVSFSELKQSGPIAVAEAFHFPLPGSTPITPQFTFPGQQLQGLFTLRRGLRDIVKDGDPEEHDETIKSLESIDDIPVPLRRLNDLMTRQLWRLQDLRDGGGLGFTIELFFLALRQLSSASSSPELKQVLYTGTFNAIKSGWEESIDSSGTQRILLNLVCDLVIKGRGVFSDFSYPEYIVQMLLELVGNMVKPDEYETTPSHVNDALEELLNVNPRDCMDRNLRTKALQKLASF